MINITDQYGGNSFEKWVQVKNKKTKKLKLSFKPAHLSQFSAWHMDVGCAVEAPLRGWMGSEGT